MASVGTRAGAETGRGRAHLAVVVEQQAWLEQLAACDAFQACLVVLRAVQCLVGSVEGPRRGRGGERRASVVGGARGGSRDTHAALWPDDLLCKVDCPAARRAPGTSEVSCRSRGESSAVSSRCAEGASLVRVRECRLTLVLLHTRVAWTQWEG